MLTPALQRTSCGVELGDSFLVLGNIVTRYFLTGEYQDLGRLNHDNRINHACAKFRDQTGRYVSFSWLLHLLESNSQILIVTGGRRVSTEISSDLGSTWSVVPSAKINHDLITPVGLRAITANNRVFIFGRITSWNIQGV